MPDIDDAAQARSYVATRVAALASEFRVAIAEHGTGAHKGPTSRFARTPTKPHELVNSAASHHLCLIPLAAERCDYTVAFRALCATSLNARLPCVGDHTSWQVSLSTVRDAIVRGSGTTRNRCTRRSGRGHRFARGGSSSDSDGGHAPVRQRIRTSGTVAMASAGAGWDVLARCNKRLRKDALRLSVHIRLQIVAIIQVRCAVGVRTKSPRRMYACCFI